MLSIRMLDIPSQWEGICHWSQPKPIALFKVHFAYCLIFMCYVGLSHIHIAPQPLLPFLPGLTGSGGLHFLLVVLGKTIYINSCATQLIKLFYLKQRCSVVSSGHFRIAVITSCILFWASWAHHPGLPPLCLFLLWGFVGRSNRL